MKSDVIFHLATMNSLQSIELLGGGEEKICRLYGCYSLSVTNAITVKTKSPYVRTRQLVENKSDIQYRSDKTWNNSLTIRQLLTILEQDNIPEVAINQVEFLLPYKRIINNYGVSKEFDTVCLRKFSKWPFKPSVWSKRHTLMPEFKIYQTFRSIITKLKSQMSRETLSRIRDSIIVNKANDLDNINTIEQLCKNRPWLVVLRETPRSLNIISLDEITKITTRKIW